MKFTPVLLLTGYLGSGKTTLVNNILLNCDGIRFAVIVNDIGEVNIDASLIEKGGVVTEADSSLVALQNGCICCSLQTDLMEQLRSIMASERFDYIVIEASGICEPEPIARTVCSFPAMGPEMCAHGIPRIDAIVTVVDALRLADEFDGGSALTAANVADNDIERLVANQIEFCNIVLLNKASSVDPARLASTREVVKALNPGADIIECDYSDVPLGRIIHTDLFSLPRVATQAAWVQGLDRQMTPEEEHRARHHHEHHDHDHDHDHDHHHHGDTLQGGGVFLEQHRYVGAFRDCGTAEKNHAGRTVVRHRSRRGYSAATRRRPLLRPRLGPRTGRPHDKTRVDLPQLLPPTSHRPARLLPRHQSLIPGGVRQLCQIPSPGRDAPWSVRANNWESAIFRGCSTERPYGGGGYFDIPLFL